MSLSLLLWFVGWLNVGCVALNAWQYTLKGHWYSLAVMVFNAIGATVCFVGAA